MMSLFLSPFKPQSLQLMLTRLSILRVLCCCINFLYAILSLFPPLLYLLVSLQFLILTQVSLFNILYQLSCLHLLAILINSSLSYLMHSWFPSLLILLLIIINSLDSSMFMFFPMLIINTIILGKKPPDNPHPKSLFCKSQL